MTCKFCKGEMELSYTEGTGKSEVKVYSCECGSLVTIHGTQKNKETWRLPFDMKNNYAWSLRIRELEIVLFLH